MIVREKTIKYELYVTVSEEFTNLDVVAAHIHWAIDQLNQIGVTISSELYLIEEGEVQEVIK